MYKRQVLESVENFLFWYLKKVYSLDKNESANISEELGNFIRRLLQTSDEIIHAASEVSEELQGQICEFILKNQEDVYKRQSFYRVISIRSCWQIWTGR